MEGKEFLQKVWSEQGTGFGFVCVRSGPTSWQDRAFKIPDELEEITIPPLEQGDIYFSPNLYKRPKRRQELVLDSCFLYADLDPVDPWAIDDEYEPSIAWESSPGRYQALWRIGQHLTPSTHGFLNKRLTYFLKADRGGWDATQVLRLPGTVNHKYDDRPPVTLLWFNTAHQRRDWRPIVEYQLPRAKFPKATGRPVKLKDLPAGLRGKLQAKSANGDRSKVLWRLERQLLQAGYSEHQVFYLVKGTVWNKFAPDDERLRQEITRAATVR